MPRRILYLLSFEIVAVGAILMRPDWGSLFLVLLLLTRPQDDRPNMQELHFPMVMTVSLAVSILARVSTRGPQMGSAVKAMAVPIGYFLLMFFSSVVNGYTAPSQAELVTMIVSLIAMFGVLVFVKTPNQLAMYVGTLVVCGMYYVKMTIQNPTFLKTGLEDTTYVRLNFRNLGNFGNPNYLALLMVLLIFLGMGFAYSGQRKLFALPVLAAVLGFFYVLLKCQSRGATVALGAGLVVFWITQKHKAVSLVFSVLILGVGLTFFAPDTFMARLASLGNYSADASLTDRMRLWSDAVNTIISHPLLGVGPGNFAYRIAFNSQHQTYLEVASELGIPGLLVLLALFGSSAGAIFSARRMVKADKDWRLLHSTAGALYACLTALFVQGFFTGFAFREFFIIIVASGYLCRLLAKEAVTLSENKVSEQTPLAETFPGSNFRQPGWGNNSGGQQGMVRAPFRSQAHDRYR